MKTIRFNGMSGRVIESSPHGNYLVVQLNKRVYVCGTYSNQFNWQENPDADSGFIASLVYVGGNTRQEVKRWAEWLSDRDAWFREGENDDHEYCRAAKRVKGYRFELKARNVDLNVLSELMQKLGEVK